MFGWHHQFNRHEFAKTLADGDGQGHLMCCSPWGHKESDSIELLNNNNTMAQGLNRLCELYRRGTNNRLWELR